MMRLRTLLVVGSARGVLHQGNRVVVRGEALSRTVRAAACTVDIPCEMVSRAERSVLNGKAAESEEDRERVRQYLVDALSVGLGVMERASASSEATRVASEFDSLLRRLEAWDASVREKLSRSSSETEARQSATLEKYLGDRGALESQVQRLRAELTDPRISTSIPAATAKAVTESVDTAVDAMRKTVDASDDASPLAHFLRASRNEATRLRVELEKAQATFAAELKQELRALVAAAGIEAAPREANVKGRDFEAEVGDALRRLASSFGDGVRDTSVERAPGSLAKVGDILVEIDAATNMVVEVKSGAFALSGATSLEKQVRDAMARRGADVGLAVVRPEKLPKRLSWYTNLKDDLVLVAFEPDLDYGDVALACAYRMLRASAVAKSLHRRANRTADSIDGQAEANRIAADAQHRAEAISKRAAEVLASIDRLRRMKKNTTDVINMLTVLRQDLDNIDREIKDALREMDKDILPLMAVPVAKPES